VRHAIVSMLPVGFSNPRTEIRPLRFVIDRLTPDGMTRTLRLRCSRQVHRRATAGHDLRRAER
jgi:hypothetical protein